MEEECKALNIEVVFVKTDPELIKKLFARLKEETKDCKCPYTEESQVRLLMRYNVWTIDQFCDISGLKVSTINNMVRPTFTANRFGLKLDFCYPHPSSDGTGPKFIVRNDKSERYVKL
jgi:hypothetical protein